MKIVFTEHSWSDYLYWQTNDKRMLRRINELIRDTMRSPFDGVGKPEPLKHQLQGCWSRRINEEHRLIYEISGEELRIISCRYHY
ncbi:MAG: Txe/YoeB family addiction module toxin [Rhodothermales bacterium]